MRLIAALAVLVCASSAAAHPAPFSYLDLRLDGTGLHGSLVVHDFDAAYELGLETPEALATAIGAPAHLERLVALLTERLSIAHDGQHAILLWGAAEVLPDRQSLRLPFRIDDRRPARVTIDGRLFPYDPMHQTFVNVYEDGELRHQAILDSTRTRMNYYPGSAQGALSVAAVFLPAGIEHILIGPDHVLFLVALLLLGGSLWRLAAIVTAFTVGHSVTLSLAALGLVSLPASLVEPVIALSIIVVGMDNLLVWRDARSRAEGAGVRDIRVHVAAVFGLIHGFGFASVLQEFGLPATALGWSLLSFNLGVEVGQLAIVLAVATALGAMRGRYPGLAAPVVVGGSIAVILAGGYWFVERVFPGGV
jgi:hydrogenase/urease accessory protein HupE